MPASSRMDPPPAKAELISNYHGEAAVLMQAMEIHGGAEIHLQPVKDLTLEQSDPEGLQAVERKHAGIVPKGLCPVIETPRWNWGKA
ncbi:hypothetical protein BTVI_80967 [Pitangus sulphuratus]|nr:hypothetical protein BTVI_80967 [Pitangus sulphuratus]